MGDISNFSYTAILLVVFSVIIYLIKPIYEKTYDSNEEEEAYKKISRFALPTISVLCFFISTYFVASIIQDGNYEFAGIYYMILICVIFTILNNTILSSDNIRQYIKGKKFSSVGLIMALGVGSIVFGFLDNFGLKLGTDALDTSFLNIFLGPFSVHNKFTDYQDNIAQNITILNTWSGSKWRSVINQLLRFNKEVKSLKTQNINGFDDFIEDLDFFLDSEKGGGRLMIPEEILAQGKETTRVYVRNIKDKYDLIDGSKNMMGNTFSDFIGAILGAAIINLFMYTTAYDGFITGDDEVDESFWVKKYNSYMPFFEAICMAIGCLLPIFINIGMTRSDTNNNKKYAWLIVGIVTLIIVGLMYISVKGVKNLNHNEKVNSMKKTIKDLQDRLDINDKNENELNQKIDNFVGSLK
jgi:hypothetical protein